jgi:hypothetical protein
LQAQLLALVQRTLVSRLLLLPRLLVRLLALLLAP